MKKMRRAGLHDIVDVFGYELIMDEPYYEVESAEYTGIVLEDDLTDLMTIVFDSKYREQGVIVTRKWSSGWKYFEEHEMFEGEPRKEYGRI